MKTIIMVASLLLSSGIALAAESMKSDIECDILTRPKVFGLFVDFVI